MRKLLYRLFQFVIAVLLVASCNFKDKGNLELIKLANVIIDTTGIPLQSTVLNGAVLEIKPVVSKDGATADDFTYEWWLTRLPGSNFAMKDVISTQKDLSVVINNDASSDYYSLWYRVTDKKTGLMSSVILRVLVEGPLTQGLTVADSEDGVHSDLSIIQDTIFTFNWFEPGTTTPKPALIKYNEFSRVHNRKFSGIIHSLFSQRLFQRQIARNFLHGASKNNIFRLNVLDYSLVGEGRDLFYDNAVNMDFDAYFLNGSSLPVLINSGKASTRNIETSTTVGFNKFGISVPGVYAINKHIAVHPITNQQAIFFDENQGKFMKLGTSVNVGAAPTNVDTTNTIFDPRNLQGYTVLGGGLGSMTEVRFVLKKDNYYGVFCFSNDAVAKARRLINISAATDIENAVSFVFPMDQAAIYYATPTSVYSIRIPQSGAITTTKLYTSADPINTFTMLRRTGTRTVNNTERCLIATTYNGTEGKVITLPIPEIGLDLGLIDVTKIKVYGGFKKISAVAIQD